MKAAAPQAQRATLARRNTQPGTIIVRTGADRTGSGSSAVSGLDGVRLHLYEDQNGSIGSDTGLTCTSTGGTCTFTVPSPGDHHFWVRQDSAPAGWFMSTTLRTGGSGGSGSSTDYAFRTGRLGNGDTISSGVDFMTTSGSGESYTDSSGIWQSSRTNPDLTKKCGLDVALVLDLSGSVGSNGVTQLKAAADSFVDQLTGTPSRVAVFSLAQDSPAATGGDEPTLQSVAASGTAVKNSYKNWTTGGGTNWDQGLWSVAQADTAANHYDAVIMITDGNPTVWGSGGISDSSRNSLRDTEYGIFAANAIKAKGTRVIGLGVGDGVSGNGGRNLRAITGSSLYTGSNATTADYFQTSDYSAAADALAEFARGVCNGTLTIVKQVRGGGPRGVSGWTFGVSPSNGVTASPASGSTDSNGAVNFNLTYPGGVSTSSVTATETADPAYDLTQQGGKNAVCTRLGGGAVGVTNVGANGFKVDVPQTAGVTCTVVNTYRPPASVTVTKQWVVNGGAPTTSPGAGFAPGQLTLTGPGSAGATNQGWGVTRSGYARGGSTTVDEGAPTLPDNCTLVSKTLGGKSLPQSVTLPNEANTFTVTNTVFCSYAPLDLTKTASGSYDTTYHWSIAKAVGASANGPFDPSAVEKHVAANGDPTSSDFGYQVTLTQGARDLTDARVTGNLLVSNPNATPVAATLHENLAGATCSFAGGADVTVPANAVDKAYAYTCTYPDGTDPADLAGTNHASLTWDRSTYPQTQGDLGAPGVHTASTSSAVTWTEHATDKTVTVTDDHHTFSPAWTATWSKQGASETRSYTGTVSTKPGTCTSVQNTATVASGQQTLASDDATAKLCVGADLAVTKNVVGSFTRTYPWSIEKTATSDKVTVDGQGKATGSYTVTVTAGDGQDSAWAMSGTVTVTNPNDWQDVSLTGITDTYDGGGTCTVDQVKTGGSFGAVSFPYSLAKGATAVFGYSCTFATKPAYDGTNTATASWDGRVAATPSSSASGTAAVTESGTWSPTKVNADVTITDDHATPGDVSDDTVLGTLQWADVYGATDHRWTHSYTIPLQVPKGGTCVDRVNTASVVGDGKVVLSSDDATVNVCNPVGLTGTKTATPSFTRTWNWHLVKQVRVSPGGAWEKAASWTGDAYSHAFDYRLLVTNDATDGGYLLSGDITVSNPNTDTAIAPLTATVSEPTTFGGVGSVCVLTPDGGLPSVQSVSVTVASKDSLVVHYSCALSGRPADATKNVATISPAQGSGATATSDPVSFTTPTSTVHGNVTVTDDKATPGETTDDAVFTLAAADAPWTSPTYTSTYTASTTGCSQANQWVNTATVTDGRTSLTSDTATAAICPNPGTWTVAKSTDVGDGPVPVDSDLTYTLSATKTGGVDPTNVVVSDDLSAISPYVDLPASFSPSEGSASLSGGQLTWTIPTLSATSTLSFTVHVKAGAYGVDLPNLVTSEGSSNCPDAQTAAEGGRLHDGQRDSALHAGEVQ